MYDDELVTASERLTILKRALTAAQRAVPSESVRKDQHRALDNLVDMTLDTFWALPPTQINQLLRRLMGNRRFVVMGGEIIGTADAPKR